jgi:NhaP-type Na+/H+ or K+/H+ antiporter
LPLTILLGFVFAAIVFPSLGILEMALLAAILAPTDAALGKPVVTNPTVPPVMREALNLESGLNDGICVPIVVILLGLAIGTQIEGGTVGHVVWVVVEEIGIGALIGLLTWVMFGGIVVARMIDRVSWPALLYAVLSLTVIRMLPVFLCLIGTRTNTADKLFIGWFGPRGLATIVFAILVLDAKLPGNDTIMIAAGWTVRLSVICPRRNRQPPTRW